MSVGKKPKGPEQPAVAFLECVPKVWGRVAVGGGVGGRGGCKKPKKGPEQSAVAFLECAPSFIPHQGAKPFPEVGAAQQRGDKYLVR